jgi:transcriptional regulator
MTYVPAHFRVSDRPALHAFMRTYDFATIVSGSPDGLVTSHVPVLLRGSDAAPVIVGHLARANDHWRSMDGARPALAIFHGPQGYVSPTWYAAQPAVPTWNYAVVHAHGRPTANTDATFTRGVVEELARRYEAHRPDGWRPESLPSDFYDGMLRAIVAFEMPVTRLEGKFKLGQNRSVEDRRRTVAGLEQERSSTAAALADFMRRHAGM